MFLGLRASPLTLTLSQSERESDQPSQASSVIHVTAAVFAR